MNGKRSVQSNLHPWVKMATEVLVISSQGIKGQGQAVEYHSLLVFSLYLVNSA